MRFLNKPEIVRKIKGIKGSYTKQTKINLYLSSIYSAANTNSI